MIVLRDAGGVGDLVRIFAVIDALAARGPVDWIVPATYADLCRACGAVAVGACRVHGCVIPRRRRRSSMGAPIERWGKAAPFPYLRVLDAPDDAPVVDLLCPALRHEVQTNARPTMDRVECWARAADAWPLPPHPVRFLPGADAEAEAADWWDDHRELNPARAIALSPASVRGLRTWRNVARRRRPARVGQIGGLILKLKELGWQGVVFDHDSAALELPAAAHSIDPRHRVQAARLRRCAGYIGPDSGFLHVAAAMGVRSIGLFGPTDGALVLAPYDRSRVLSLSGAWTERVRRRIGCERPCYGFRSGGFNPQTCASRCEVLEGIGESRIAEEADRFFRGRGRSLIVRGTA